MNKAVYALMKHLFPASLYAIFALCLVNFPHIFSYGPSKNAGLVLVILLVILGFLGGFPAVKAKFPARLFSFYQQYFPYFLLGIISLLSVAVLNEKLFHTNPSGFGIGTDFTIGSFMPMSDAAGYLQDVQQFLSKGNFQNSGIFRPFAIFVMAMIYYCSGGDLAVYFYLTTALLISSCFFVCQVVSKMFSKTLALIVAFALCRYFAMYQGTFLTEIPGGIVGMLSLAIILKGLFLHRTAWFIAGLFLLGMAMQIRTGSLLMLPLILVYGAMVLRKKGRWSFSKIMIAGIFAIGLSSMLPFFQLMLLKKPLKQVSNVWILAYQIQTNSATWKQAYYDIRELPLQRTQYDKFQIIKQVTIQKIKDNPGTFVSNYFHKIANVIRNPIVFLFPFTSRAARFMSIAALIAFFFTYFLVRKDSNYSLLFLFLVTGLAGHILSAPFSNVVPTRPGAATVGFGALIFAIGVSNLLLLAGRGVILVGKKVLSWSPGSFAPENTLYSTQFQTGNGIHEPHPVISGRPFHFQMGPGLPKVVISLMGRTIAIGAPIIAFFGLVSILAVGPIFLDRIRKSPPPLPNIVWEELKADKGIFVLNISSTPHAAFFPGSNFKITDPYLIPGDKLKANCSIGTLPEYPFYFFNAVNQHPFGPHQNGSKYLIVPTSLIPPLSPDSAHLVFLKGKSKSLTRASVLLADQLIRVLSIEKK